MEFKSIILAAGKGTRMKSDLPKVLHKVNGTPMVVKVMEVLEEAGSKENILILGHMLDLVLEKLGNPSYVEQKEQLGTGHAIKMAEEKLKDYDGTIVITCGDTPLLTNNSINELVKHHLEKGAKGTILTAIEENPFGYGRIVKEGEKVVAIIEEKEATEEIKAIKEVNAGVYCFDNKTLFDALKEINNDNEKGEYYLTDVIKILVGRDELIESYQVKDNSETLGVNSKVQLAEAEATLRKRKNIELMEEGVILINPEATYVEDKVKIGRDTIIYPNAIIRGNTVIGENCEILGNTKIDDSIIGNNVKIESSSIEKSRLDDKVTIGPYAHIRPETHLKEEVHVGNFVETKKSVLEKGVKAGHLTYIGDAEIGEFTNIGAGTITCNYDGKNKYKTIIGKNVFVGSDTKFVAPVTVGDDALTAAGSVITKNIPDRALAFARARQDNKKEWNKR